MNFSRKDFEKQGLAADGVVYIQGGETCSIHCSAFIALSTSVIAGLTSKDVFDYEGTEAELTDVTIPMGMMIPIPGTTSFSLDSGDGFLILDTRRSI